MMTGVRARCCGWSDESRKRAGLGGPSPDRTAQVGKSGINTCIAGGFRETGRRVSTVLRAGAAGLCLMVSGPWLASLPLDFLERLPGLRLRPLPLALYRWAHSRRKLREIYDRSGSEIAAEGLRRIAELYAIEADIRAARRSGVLPNARRAPRPWSRPLANG